MRKSQLVGGVILMLLCCLSGCTSLNEQAFMGTQGNTLQLVHPKDLVRDVVVSTLTEKGFQTQFSGNIIKGTKKIQDGNKTISILHFNSSSKSANKLSFDIVNKIFF